MRPRAWLGVGVAAGPLRSYAIYLWDISQWLADLYAAEAEASKRRREKLQAAMSRAKALMALGNLKMGNMISMLKKGVPASTAGSCGAAVIVSALLL